MPADHPVAPHLVASAVGVRHGSVTALTGVDLTVAAGEVVGIVGPNGSGKSSLVRVLSGLDRPTTGRCFLHGRDVMDVPDRVRARLLAHVGQDEHSEMPFTAREVLLLGRTAGRRDWDRLTDDDEVAVDRLVATLSLGHLTRRALDRMSGGERQRVLIGRALAQRTEVITLDEPTNHLDVRHQHHVMEVLVERHVTTVVVLHDLNLAAAYCSRIVMLDRGRVVADGTPSDVLTADRVAAVYGVNVRRIDLDDRPHLVLGR